MACSKRKYNTENMALLALKEARIRFSGNNATGIYLCDDCGYWHLTSKSELHPAIKSELESGQLKREQAAWHWENKLRKKY